MALWGNKDTKAVTGTVAVANSDATVTGTTTDFVSELAPGQTLVIATVPYKIAAIANTTSLELDVVYAGTTASGLTVTANESPAYVPHTEKATIFGVDTTEAAETPQITHAGWVKQTTGSGGRSGRVTYETLVAMRSIAGDAEDVAFPDARITISAQPANVADATDPVTTFFAVTATATQGVTPTYQWQVDEGAGFGNITDGGVYSTATTASLTITGADKTTYDGYAYRCVVSGTGAASVTSSSATLVFA